MAQRLAYRRRLSYNTPSNKVKKVRAPQCNLVLQYTKKRGKAPRCGDCNSVIAGVRIALILFFRFLPGLKFVYLLRIDRKTMTCDLPISRSKDKAYALS